MNSNQQGIFVKDKMRVVITDYGFPDVTIERELVGAAGGNLAAFHCKTEQELIDAVKDADALLVQFAPITRPVIESLTRCKTIVRYGVGVDNIDLDAARSRGIAVCNVPDYCVNEVADHTFAMALALTRQLTAVDAQMRRGVWLRTPPRPMPASRQMTFVTIGFGRIARAVLDRARACQFNVATCDSLLSADAEILGSVRNLSLNQALAAADVLSLHVPLTVDTRHLINAHTLALLRPGSILINTARGGLVDSLALAEALSKAQLAGAGLDVFEEEPLPAGHPLLNCPNVLLTSHLAWCSQASGLELQRLAAEEVVRVLRGQPAHSQVA
jgi:D-3-phosphoglycerate dehydrogenase